MDTKSDRIQKQTWTLRSSSGHEGSFVFQTIVLPGSASSLRPRLRTKEDEVQVQYESEVGDTRKIKTGFKTVISTLVSTSELSVLRTLASSITSSPPPIKDPAYVIRKTATKGLGMFAQRDIGRGELIAWDRPGIIAPGLEWEGKKAKREEVYELLANGLVDLKSIDGHTGEAEDELKDEGRRRLEEIRGMAISSCFGGDHWVEGVIGANALVLELGNGNKKGKEERKVIYGGVYPLINRCNHRLAHVFFTTYNILMLLIQLLSKCCGALYTQHLYPGSLRAKKHQSGRGDHQVICEHFITTGEAEGNIKEELWV